MNLLGGSAEEPPRQDAKRRAVGSRDESDLKKITTVLAKLCLSNALRARCLQSILLTVLLVPESDPFVKVGLEATKQWTDKVKSASREERDKLGLPHVHCFNAMLSLCLRKLTEKGGHDEQVATINTYCNQSQAATNPVQHIASDVRYWRIQRNFDRDFKRIELNVNIGTKAHAVSLIVKDMLIQQEGVREMPGIAPAGDLERKVQAWLDSNGGGQTQTRDE